MINKKLYIIGNGFDLYHWLETETYPNTSYQNFAYYLKQHKREIFDWLVTTCALPHDPLGNNSGGSEWNNFEKAIGEFEGEEILEHCQNYMDDSDPHRSGEASWEAQRIVSDLTDNLKDSLRSFIVSLPYPADISSISLPIDPDALFLSFNYTDTLERYYNVSANNICYIHGKAMMEASLQIGHNISQAEIEQEETSSMPPNLTPEQEEAWQDEMNSEYSRSGELTIGAINCYWEKSFKNAEENIEKNKSFFDRCEGVVEVIVMGHSLSEVDLPYFDKIQKRTHQYATWKVSYHDEVRKAGLVDSLIGLGVSKEKVTLFKLPSLVQRSQAT